MTEIDIDNLDGTKFQKDVWKAILKIPKGKTISYKELAILSGHQKAIRAVANAVGANPLPVIIPCHRVIRKDGTIGGYSGIGGIKTKIKLLKQEKIDINI